MEGVLSRLAEAQKLTPRTAPASGEKPTTRKQCPACGHEW